MPFAEKMFPRLNRRLTYDTVHELPPEPFERDEGLSGALRDLGVIERDAEAAFVDQMPLSMQAAALAIVRTNLKRDRPKQMIVSWAPGYDWEMRVWETGSTGESEGGITIQVFSRYPSDAHPVGRA